MAIFSKIVLVASSGVALKMEGKTGSITEKIRGLVDAQLKTVRKDKKLYDCLCRAATKKSMKLKDYENREEKLEVGNIRLELEKLLKDSLTKQGLSDEVKLAPYLVNPIWQKVQEAYQKLVKKIIAKWGPVKEGLSYQDLKKLEERNSYLDEFDRLVKEFDSAKGYEAKKTLHREIHEHTFGDIYAREICTHLPLKEQDRIHESNSQRLEELKRLEPRVPLKLRKNIGNRPGIPASGTSNIYEARRVPPKAENRKVIVPVGFEWTKPYLGTASNQEGSTFYGDFKLEKDANYENAFNCSWKEWKFYDEVVKKGSTSTKINSQYREGSGVQGVQDFLSDFFPCPSKNVYLLMDSVNFGPGFSEDEKSQIRQRFAELQVTKVPAVPEIQDTESINPDEDMKMKQQIFKL